MPDRRLARHLVHGDRHQCHSRQAKRMSGNPTDRRSQLDAGFALASLRRNDDNCTHGLTASPVASSVGRMLHGLDDLHVARAAADVAAERFPDLALAGLRIAPQQARRGHDEARRAVAALGAELLVKPALHGRQARRPCPATPPYRPACRKPFPASVRQESVGLSSTSTVQAPHSPPSQPVLVPVRPCRLAQVVEQQPVAGHRIDAFSAR